MEGPIIRIARWAAVTGALTVAAAACDRNPSAPPVAFPSVQVAFDTAALAPQGNIRFVFSAPLSPQNAQDAANFVVLNLCTGLQIPGAVRLSGDRDTLVFSPSSALPYLTRIGVRIQNLQAANGAQLLTPITQTAVTAAPPVADQSWRLLNSPTNDLVLGIDFADGAAGSSPSTGYLLTFGGGLYRTQDGGNTFGAVFKAQQITNARNLFEFGTDTVYFTAVLQNPNGIGGTTVFRSRNAGVNVDTMAAPAGTSFFGGRFVKLGGLVRGEFAAQSQGPQFYSYRETSAGASALTRSVVNGITDAANSVASDVELSRDTTVALGVGYVNVSGTTNPRNGLIFLSTDGGNTYSTTTTTGAVYAFRGAAFINATTALLVGDSAGVYRYNLTNGQLTAVSVAGSGVPTDSVNPRTGEVIIYQYQRAAFDQSGQNGYVVGLRIRRVPGTPDQRTGVILQSVDGGTHWRQQAVSGASNNGTGFSPVVELKYKNSGLAALAGLNGLAAIRLPSAQATLAPCSLSQP